MSKFSCFSSRKSTITKTATAAAATANPLCFMWHTAFSSCGSTYISTCCRAFVTHREQQSAACYIAITTSSFPSHTCIHLLCGAVLCMVYSACYFIALVYSLPLPLSHSCLLAYTLRLVVYACMRARC